MRIVKDINKLVEMLPQNERILVYELVKRMVFAWDSDYTKLTDEERKRLELGKKDFENGDTINHEEINWS